MPYVRSTCEKCGKPRSRSSKSGLCAPCFNEANEGTGLHATTAEERNKLRVPLCNAKKKDGTRCRAFAGQGTDHKGIGKCKYHGGSTKSHRASAVIVEARRQAIVLGRPVDVQPHQALVGMLRATAGHVAWLNAEIAELGDLSDHESNMLVRLYGEERDRLTRIAKACLDAGVEEREVELSQRYAEQISKAVENAITTVNGLTTDQRRQFGQVLRMELAAIQESAEPQHEAA